jgi:hypothetical protein
MANPSHPGLRVVAAKSFEELESLRSFWTTANKHPDADIDFYKYFVGHHAEAMQPCVLAARENGKPRALLLARLEETTIPIRLGYFTILRLRRRQLITLQDGYLGEAAPGVEAALVREVLRLLRECGADRAILSNLPLGDGLQRAAKTVPGLLSRDYAGRRASRWKTTLPASLDEFLKRRSKKHRYWLRRIERVFADDHKGKVEYKTYRTCEDLEAFCAHAEKIAQTTYQRGLGVGFMDNADTRQRLKLAADKGWLRGYVVFAGGEPLAFWCGRLYNGVMVLDWTGYLPAFRKYELGTVLFLKMVEDLCKAGAREIDYGTGTSFYKERFGDQETAECFVALHAPTFRGVSLSALTTMEAVFNGTAKYLAKKLKVMDRVKKLWRRRLAEGADKEGGSADKGEAKPE